MKRRRRGRCQVPRVRKIQLKPGAAAIDAGLRLPQVTEGFAGAAPDLGALEVGQATAVSSDGSMVTGIDALNEFYSARGYIYNTRTSEFKILDIYEECPWWEWFCFGDKPFNP